MDKERVAWPTGARVTNVRTMTQAEADQEGWGNPGGSTVIELDNGGIIYASRDPEGNGPGMLFGQHGQTSLYIVPADACTSEVEPE